MKILQSSALTASTLHLLDISAVIDGILNDLHRWRPNASIESDCNQDSIAEQTIGIRFRASKCDSQMLIIKDRSSHPDWAATGWTFKLVAVEPPLPRLLTGLVMKRAVIQAANLDKSP